MKKIKWKDEKVKEEKAAESSVKVDIIMLNDKVNEMKDKINKLELAVDGLLAKPKEFVPVVTGAPVVSDKNPSVSRYDDVCKEIDEKIK